MTSDEFICGARLWITWSAGHAVALGVKDCERGGVVGVFWWIPLGWGLFLTACGVAAYLVRFYCAKEPRTCSGASIRSPRRATTGPE